MKIPDDLAPWCDGCLRMDLELNDERLFSDGRPVLIKFSISCKHRDTCRAAVAQAHKLENAMEFLEKKMQVPHE